MSAALEGLQVLDLTHLIAGPFATKWLSDYGADVIKVEPPCGEAGDSSALSPVTSRIPNEIACSFT